MRKDNRKFCASISVRNGEERAKLELSPAPLHGGPEGFYRVRLARRWLDTEDGAPRFFDRDGLARLAAELALCGLEKLRLGETGRSKLLANLMFGAYNRKFPDARTPNDWICSDPEVVAKYTADPLCGQDATVGLTREMLRGIRMIQRPANLQRMDKALPVFFIAGRSDPVGNMGRGVEKAAAAFRAAGMQDVACKLYDGRHEILNEKDRQLVYDDVLAFYERHLD